MARDAGGRFLPDLDTLQRRDAGALTETLQRFGMSVDPERMRAAIEHASIQLTAAEFPSATVIERTERAITRAVEDEMRRVAKDYVRDRERQELRITRTTMLTWIDISDSGTCQDCAENGGEEHTADYWERHGEPGSANLICSHRCRCRLLPSGWLDVAADDEEAA